MTDARAVTEIVQSLVLDATGSANVGTSAASANVTTAASGSSSAASNISQMNGDATAQTASPVIADQPATDELAVSTLNAAENADVKASASAQEVADTRNTGSASQPPNSLPATNGPAAKAAAQQDPGPTMVDLAAQLANIGGRPIQVTASPADNSAAPQTSGIAQVLGTANTTATVSAQGQAPLPQTAKTSSAAQRSIAQQIQPDIANLLGIASGANAVAAVNAAASNNAGNGTQNQGNGTAHTAAQTAAQVSAAQTHSSDDSKGTGSGGTQDGRSALGQNSAAQVSAVTLAANQSALLTGANGEVSHAAGQVATQIATQANMAGATTDAKSAAAPSAGAQSLPTTTSLPASLPRSLDDVAQATQLYQRVGGAEMHIAMDTESLGAIDLRAVVHQGSLSATIAVQRPDVQTLLVNELPALQHSLAEKNLQVNQISVLAGSIGSGTNMNGEPHQQSQNRPSTPLFTGTFAQSDAEPAVSRVQGSESVLALGSSGRLSVLA